MTNRSQLAGSSTRSRELFDWVAEMAWVTKADRIVWCDGSEQERQRLTELAVSTDVLIPLNQNKRPGCYLHRSNPNDVARAEDLTFICTPSRDEAGPTNNWMPPNEAYRKLRGWLEGSMRGRTMYVVPYVPGPIGSPFAKVGVELTDSLYVVLNMRIITRMGRAEEWLPELDLQEQFFGTIGETLPPELDVQREALRAGLEQNWQAELSSSVKV